jgi:hypothetical protein
MTDSVFCVPSEFSIIQDVLPSMMDTHEFIIPKSMLTSQVYKLTVKDTANEPMQVDVHQ